ncbi:alpha/beta hydrolase [Nocardia higoensis]|uniref:Alpha/beta hydrolase n=1 Tax=Nocardia higoensis TaxID=228599 RepID=A0ABS0D8I3_9NOCA|nr:alpha/beta hydrolase [Nocardia higoensis]MBF6353083.1 alpha/beta hydrolase [Nocardia higoensis]
MTVPTRHPPYRFAWDPDVTALIARIESNGTAPARTVGVEAARRALESVVRPPGPAMAAVRDATIDGPHGPIPLRVYRPHAAPETDAPALVWFHGGGMIMGSLASFDRLARDIAEATGAVVFNIEYRLAPEHRYPVANDEAYAALCWVHENAAEWGVGTTRIGVGGDSAGGGLATATALRSRDLGGPAIAQQVLFYPGIERRTDRPSMREFGDSPFLTAADIDWMKSLYLGEDPTTDDAYGVPARADSLADLPPAILAVGYGDPLRDAVEAYGDRLRDAGVPTAQLRYPGVGHGFLMQTAALARARAAMAEVGALVAARFRLHA